MKPQIANTEQLKAMQPAHEIRTGFKTHHVFSKHSAFEIMFSM